MICVLDNGRTMSVNDEIRVPLLCWSARHAGRIVRWLGLSGYRIREATEGEIAAGMLDSVKAPKGATAKAEQQGIAVH